MAKRPRLVQGEKLRGAEKIRRIPARDIPTATALRKPDWIRVRMRATPRIAEIRKILRDRTLASVCEEASCPNLSECFAKGTATFMIMGDICTRRCPFCDVSHGRPNPLDEEEPANLAAAIREMQLSYVVVTSVDRDDLADSGAAHFAACIDAIRLGTPEVGLEVLVPDFRGRLEPALEHLSRSPPDIFNHNLETVPRLYDEARPGADYGWSLQLLDRYKSENPRVTTKSGLMLGLGETREEIEEVLTDLRAHQVEMVTLGQYLQPSKGHLPVHRYVEPGEFEALGDIAEQLGFSAVASGPLVRSSYHADLQASGDFSADP